jgi:TolB-like protein/Tfp pilus assembly protein PilF
MASNRACETIRSLEREAEKFRIPPKSFKFHSMTTRFEFGPFIFDAQRRMLLKNGVPVEIGQKRVALLHALLRAEGQVVSKLDLMNAAWQTLNIEESNLSVQIAALRKCLGRSSTGDEWIRTIQRIGYQFVIPEATSPAGDDQNSMAGALRLGSKPSIVVLPFTNMSGDAEQEYFADGIVEELTVALSHMRWLFVVSSSFHYKGRGVGVRQVGRELGVRYALEGSVRKAGSKLRIAAQLVDAEMGTNLWAERFQGSVDDIFDLQDQLTAKVVGAISPRLEAAEIERMKRKPTANLDAYDHFLRGMAGLHKWTREGNEEALGQFYRAIELDPNYAAAHGLAARTFVQRNSGGWMRDRAGEVIEAERLARRAVVLGHDDAEALCTAGFALADICGELADGDAFIDRSIEINPNLAWAWIYSGWVKASRGEPDLALERLERARELSPLDPQSFSIRAAIAFAHFVGGRYAEALPWVEASARDRPDFLLPNLIAASSAGLAGELGYAKKAMARVRVIDPALRLSNVQNVQAMRREDFLRWCDGLAKAGLPQ